MTGGPEAVDVAGTLQPDRRAINMGEHFAGTLWQHITVNPSL